MTLRQVQRTGHGRFAAAVALLCCAHAVLAEDIAPFRVTGVDGHLQFSYLSDGQTQSTGGASASTDKFTLIQEELFLNTHSYVYHPNFLDMEVGGGPLFVQSSDEQFGVGSRAAETLYNLVGRLNFLEQKPYPLTLYYEHLNPTLFTSLTQSFVQTNTKKGATFSLRDPLSPVLVTADAYQMHSEGQSTSWIVNDDSEQASLRLSSAIGQDGYGQMSYQVNRQDSLSGNPALTIVPATVENRNASLETRILFGEKNSITWTNGLSLNSLSYVRPDFTIERQDLHFAPDLRWQHSDAFTSFYSYNLYKATEQMVETTNQSGRAGLSYHDGERVMTTFDVHGEDNRVTGLTLQSYGAGVQASYTQPMSNSVLRLSAGVIYDQKDRQAAVTVIDVLGEHVTLVDGIPVTLAQEFIDTTTIRVFNLARTQEYCPEVTPLPPGCTVADYRIIVIGTRTQIQRLATGNILDGQEVLVDYAYQTGGSAVYSTLDQTYQVSLTLLRNYTIYVRHRELDYQLDSGMPTLAFNSQRNTLYGFRVDQPLARGFSTGGEIMFENQDEVYAPYERRSVDAYLQLASMFRTFLRVSARRTQVDYFNSPEDVDLTGWSAQWRASPWDYTSLTAETNYEIDTGGTLRRMVWRNTAGLEWHIRQLSVRAEAQYSREEQGTFERDRTVLRFTARRDFR